MIAANGCLWSRPRAVVAACAATALIGCGGTPAPPAAPPPPRQAEPPAAASPLTIRLEPVPQLVIKPGESHTIPVTIDRENVLGQIAGMAGEAGILGDVTFTLGPPPPGITLATRPLLGEGWKTLVDVTASERLGDEDLTVSVPVTATLRGVSAAGSVPIKVVAFVPPTIEADSVPLLQPGQTGTVRLFVNRHGFGQPISFTAETPPAGISCEIEADPEHREVVTVSITAATTLPDGRHAIALKGLLLGRDVRAEPAVQVIARPFAFGPVRRVMVAPGATVAIDWPISRPACDGAIDIAIDGLPAGVHAQAESAVAGAAVVRVAVTADASAQAGIHVARLRGTAGRFVVEQPFVIRVAEADPAAVLDAVAGMAGNTRLVRPGSYAGRLTAGGKESLGRLFGGSEQVSTAVLRGLEWLARLQQPDGSWSLADGGGTPIAGTALALLPFLGEGVSHARAPDQPRVLRSHTRAVEKGLAFLATKQVMNRGPRGGSFGGTIREHALATIAFCEDYALSRDDRAKLHARHAVAHLVATQDHRDGGWGPEPEKPADVESTCWGVAALRSAQLAGVGAPTRVLDQAAGFIDACAVAPHDTAAVAGVLPGHPPPAAATAGGLLARMALGRPREHPELQAGVKWIAEQVSVTDDPTTDTAPLPAYDEVWAAAQVLFHMEGEAFDTWYPFVCARLLRDQRNSGAEAGSWDPPAATSGRTVSRVESTVAAVLTLQTPYRHLPLYRTTRREAAEPGGDEASAAK